MLSDLSKKRKNKSSSTTCGKKQNNTSNPSAAESTDPPRGMLIPSYTCLLTTRYTKSSVTTLIFVPLGRGSKTFFNLLDHFPLPIMYPYGSSEQQTTEKSKSEEHHQKKAINNKTIAKKDCNEKKMDSLAMGTLSKVPSSPYSPAMRTRSKKKT